MSLSFSLSNETTTLSDKEAGVDENDKFQPLPDPIPLYEAITCQSPVILATDTTIVHIHELRGLVKEYSIVMPSYQLEYDSLEWKTMAIGNQLGSHISNYQLMGSQQGTKLNQLPQPWRFSCNEVEMEEDFLARKLNEAGSSALFDGSSYTTQNLANEVSKQLPLTLRIVLDAFVIHQKEDATPANRIEVLMSEDVYESLGISDNEVAEIVTTAVDGGGFFAHNRPLKLVAADLLAAKMLLKTTPKDVHVSEKLLHLFSTMLLKMNSKRTLMECLDSVDYVDSTFLEWKVKSEEKKSKRIKDIEQRR